MTADRTDAIRALLLEAEEAHGNYEMTALEGVYDEEWPRWYAEYLVEHGLGDLTGAPISVEGVTDQLVDGYAEFENGEAKAGESWADHIARTIARAPDR